MSPNRFGRDPGGTVDHFWFGTGVHYALEDFHGYNRYATPDRAFLAYAQATKAVGKLPPSHKELTDLGICIMQYYSVYWLRNRSSLPTYWVDGKPQVEVQFEIQLPIEGPDGIPIVYHGTMDRIAIDEHGRLWIVEYKTAKMFRLYHFDTDDQISSYSWAAYCIYDKPIAGVIYMQFKKTPPEKPRILATGKVSVNKNQHTTAVMYRQTLLDVYGSMANVPADNIRFLNNLIVDETEDADLFIRRDFIERNEYQIGAQGEKIMMEVAEMANPDLPLYPNPTKDCGWQCPLQSVCLAMDDGSDYESLLGALTTNRKEEDTQWRQHLPSPDQLPKLELLEQLPTGNLPELEEENLETDLLE